MFSLQRYYQSQHSMRLVILLSVLAGGSRAWDSDEMDLFDLVEEVNENFYTLLGLDQSAATTKDVRQAYKRLALVLHPDKVSIKKLFLKKKLYLI